jgi:hypothetical protein
VSERNRFLEENSANGKFFHYRVVVLSPERLFSYPPHQVLEIGIIIIIIIHRYHPSSPKMTGYDDDSISTDSLDAIVFLDPQSSLNRSF